MDFFFVFFLVMVFLRLSGGHGGPFGGPWVDLGAIWGAFLGNFGDFFGLGLIFGNVRFTIVKPYFLRSWIVTFSCCVFVSILLGHF